MAAPDAPTTLVRMAVPVIISFTLRFLFQSVDLVFASQIDRAEGSASAVAAIGAWVPFQGVYIALWVGLSAGFTAALGRAFGRRDARRAEQLKRAMLRLQGFLVPTLFAGGIGLWFAVPHMGLDPELAESFRIYGTTLALGLPLTGFWSTWPDSVVKAHYDTRSTMIAGILATATNITLNALFALVLGWGIFGIALATVISRIPAFLYALAKAREHERKRLAGEAWPDVPAANDESGRSPLRAILMLSIPGSLTYVLTATEGALVLSQLVDLEDSTRAVASLAVYNQLLSLALMPTVAASIAIVPYVARMAPEGHVSRVMGELRNVVLMAGAFGLLFTVPSGVLFPAEIGAFFVSAKSSDAVGSPLTKDVLSMLPFAALAGLPFLLFRPVFEALQRPTLGIAASALRFVILAFPAVLLAKHYAADFDVHPLQAIVVALIGATLLASTLVTIYAWRALKNAQSD